MNYSDRTPTLAESAYDRIKNALCQGLITQGSILSENGLAAEFNMSRTPVREAIRMLETEGWLEVKKGKGAYVRPLSGKDIADLFEVRRLLEAQAGKTAVFHITDEEIDDFEKRFRALYEQSVEGRYVDQEAFSDLDWEFHSLLINRSENRYIRSVMHNNNQNLRRFQRLSATTLGNLKESTAQHLNLLALIRRRDPEALSAAIEAHVRWAANLISPPENGCTS